MSDNTGHDRHIYKNGRSGGGFLHATFQPSPKYGGRGGGGGEEEKRGKEEECAVYCALCKLQDPLEVVCYPSFLTCCFMD